jgi:hypothetical protein
MKKREILDSETIETAERPILIGFLEEKCKIDVWKRKERGRNCICA